MKLKFALLLLGIFLCLSGCAQIEAPIGTNPSPYTASPSPTLVPTAAPPPITNTSSFQVDFIDVGQGDSMLISSDGAYALVDGGNVADSSRIYRYLNDRGIVHLDYMFGSHPHEDHIGGLSGALSLVSVGTILSPTQSYDSKAFASFAEKAAPYGGLQVPAVGDVFSLGSAQIVVLGLNAGTETNDTSLMLKIVYGNTAVLLTGDGETVAEKALLGQDLSATVLKVGHHGSATSTSYQFLKEIMPAYAVISVGQDNPYGHPEALVLSRLEDAGVQVFRTDTQGDISCTSDGKTMHFVTQK